MFNGLIKFLPINYDSMKYNYATIVDKQLATKKNCLYSRQLFQQLARVDKLVFDV